MTVPPAVTIPSIRASASDFPDGLLSRPTATRGRSCHVFPPHSVTNACPMARATSGDQLTPEAARAIGQAFVTLWGGKTWHERPRVAVGRDNRPSGKSLADALIDGIVTAGGTVIDVGE